MAIPEKQQLILFPVGVPSSLVLLTGVQSHGVAGTVIANTVAPFGVAVSPVGVQANAVAGSPQASLLAPQNSVAGVIGTSGTGNISSINIGPSLYFPVPTGLLLNGNSGPNIAFTATSLNAGALIGTITVTTDSGAPFLGYVTIGGTNANLFSLSPIANVLTSFYNCNLYIAQSNLVANSYSISLVPTSASAGVSEGLGSAGILSLSENIFSSGIQSNGSVGSELLKVFALPSGAQSNGVVGSAAPLSFTSVQSNAVPGSLFVKIQPSTFTGVSGLSAVGSVLPQDILTSSISSFGNVGSIFDAETVTVSGVTGLGSAASISFIQVGALSSIVGLGSSQDLTGQENITAFISGASGFGQAAFLFSVSTHPSSATGLGSSQDLTGQEKILDLLPSIESFGLAGNVIPGGGAVSGVQANAVAGVPLIFVYEQAWSNGVAGSIGSVVVKPNVLSATGLALPGTTSENIQFNGIIGASANGLAGTVTAQSLGGAFVSGVSALGSAKTFTITEQLPISLVTAQAVGQAATSFETIKPATIGGTSGVGSAAAALQQVFGLPTGNFGLGTVGSLVLPANTAALVGVSGLTQAGSAFVSEVVTSSAGVASVGTASSLVAPVNILISSGSALGSVGTLSVISAPRALTASSSGVAGSLLLVETSTISTVSGLAAAGAPFKTIQIIVGSAQSNGSAGIIIKGAVPISGVAAVGTSNTFTEAITDTLASVQGSTSVASLSVSTSESQTVFVLGAEAFVQTNNISEAIAFKSQGAACAGAAGITTPDVPSATIGISSTGVAGSTSDLIVAFEPGVLAQAMAGAAVSTSTTADVGVSASTSEGNFLPVENIPLVSAHITGTIGNIVVGAGTVNGTQSLTAAQDLFETLIKTQTGVSGLGLVNFPPEMILVSSMSGIFGTGTVGSIQPLPTPVLFNVSSIGSVGTLLPSQIFFLQFTFGGVTSQALVGNLFAQSGAPGQSTINGTSGFAAANILSNPTLGPTLTSALTTGTSADFIVGGQTLIGVLGLSEESDLVGEPGPVPIGAIMYALAGNPSAALINPIDIISGRMTLPPGTPTTLTPAQHINIRIKTR